MGTPNWRPLRGRRKCICFCFHDGMKVILYERREDGMMNEARGEAGWGGKGGGGGGASNSLRDPGHQFSRDILSWVVGYPLPR